MSISEEAYSPLQKDQNPILFVPQVNIQLTGGKIQNILDSTLQKCYKPLFHMNWFKRKLYLIFEDFELNAKAKLSKKPRSEFIQDLYNLFVTEDEETFLFKIEEMGMNRNYLQEIVDNFLKETNDLDETECQLFESFRDSKLDVDCNSKLLNLEEHFDGIPYQTISKIRKTVKYWFDIYLQFKSMIAAKYYRLAYKFAKQEAALRSGLELDSLFKSLLIALNLAIDRYNSEKGALASYIQTWLKAYILNESCGLELGQAFKLNSWNMATLKKSNINSYAISTDSEEYREAKSKEEENSLNEDFQISFDCFDSQLLNVLWKINDANVDFTRKILGIPKCLNV